MTRGQNAKFMGSDLTTHTVNTEHYRVKGVLCSYTLLHTTRQWQGLKKYELWLSQKYRKNVTWLNEVIPLGRKRN
jgi:hypothetical protein